jgi:hypothetical protein
MSKPSAKTVPKTAPKSATKPRIRRPRTAAKKAPGGLGLAATTSAEDDAFDQAFRMLESARRSLLAAEAKLRIILRDSTDPTEQAQASAELLENVRQQSLLEALRLALESRSATLRPPSAESIAESQRLAAVLAQVLATNAKVSAFVAVTADIVRLIEKLVA